MNDQVSWSGGLEWLCRTGVFLSFSSILSSSGFFLIVSFSMFSQWCDFLLHGRIMMEGNLLLFPVNYHATF